eukprot:gnl/TRDRNA2_/TRDRNA2_194496_c0_seq1.p1 gnl/TRDRNA2_/TRDRNA2_194496_c0~~gnl/TRDRNA2_/TRDRNA2_194496_c0_seq1.p1  ORF type:complete len:482 (+),score=91.14 gnl/TRDRNA2_/TRDRNA2_194496_c0_seq1:175-1446(+)
MEIEDSPEYGGAVSSTSGAAGNAMGQPAATEVDGITQFFPQSGSYQPAGAYQSVAPTNGYGYEAPPQMFVKTEPMQTFAQQQPQHQQQPRRPPKADDDALSAAIFGQLQRLVTGVKQEPTPQEDLSQQLLSSLRTLGPQGEIALACQGSAAGQELMRQVQGMGPEPMPLPDPVAIPFFCKTERAASGRMEESWAPVHTAGTAALAVEALVGSEGEPIRMPPVHLGAKALKKKVEMLDDQADGAEEVGPIRLPPGFGAIPEDLVEARLKAKEEERIRQIKSTQLCRFGKHCKKRECPQAHPDGRVIDTQINPCGFGVRCKRKDCFYDHPDGRNMDSNPEIGMCKFGAKCKRADCLYDHPADREPVATVDNRICYFCHDTGHIATDCPRNPDCWAFQPALTNGEKKLAIEAGPANPPLAAKEEVK